VHVFWHVPQWDGSDVVSVSQPFAATPSQSAHPSLHETMVHVLPCALGVHWDVAFARAQVSPQALQFWLVPSIVPHPHAASPGQVVYPAGHERLHAPCAQGQVPPHALPHAPQFMGSSWRFASHPSAACPSQSVHPASQYSTAHAPAKHQAVAWGSAHTFPHAPQLFSSFAVSTQTPAQSVSPGGHAEPPPAPPLPAWPPAPPGPVLLLPPPRPPPLALALEAEVEADFDAEVEAEVEAACAPPAAPPPPAAPVGEAF
jgi:hypothetical protein